jgi:hypothetical protein
MDRLSSNYLYHYKCGMDVVKLTLKGGFRYNLWEEKVIFKNSIQQNFMVCFCDILADQADYHRNCYGDIAIVLTKEWGINKNISPVRYVHKNSIGQLSDYIKIKNINREIKDAISNDANLCHYAYQHILMGVAKDNNQLPCSSYTQSLLIANSTLEAYVNNLESEFENLVDELKKLGKEQILYKYLDCLGRRLGELYNELEARDAFMRIYQDDFGTIKNKILYDEREWRSIPNIPNIDSQEYTNAINNKYLPDNYNLTFASDDFVAILVKEQKQIDELKDFISNNNTLLDKNKDLNKIQLYDNFNE